MLKQQGKAILQEINEDFFIEKEVRLFLKREDLLHDKVSGNKWRKLKYNLEAAKKEGHKTLLTFGGAYSNHIYATAAAAKEMGFSSIGIIRGERITPLNPTLSFAEEMGMKFHFVSRTMYREKSEPFFIDNLHNEFGNFYLIPEGGTNNLAIKGCTEIADEIDVPFDYLCTSVGTGGTISGVIASLPSTKVIGFSALKGDFLNNEVKTFLKNYGCNHSENWNINTQYHFGGYAKVQPSLIDFINAFKLQQGIQLDPIYTGKMMYGIYDLIKQGYFKKGTTIVALHTGGLQGIEGIKERYGIAF
ncbi:MAG: pyridoxal-phosphate dependent enzyme [Cyclobacteriaceae bacterium]|nr:pyridoxal-phosphate dependent enzyme [Cyclobacteriaceae bacterium]